MTLNRIAAGFEHILYTRVLIEVKKAFDTLREDCENIRPPSVRDKIIRKEAEVLKTVVGLLADELTEDYVK